jgi:hypothetical protein
LWRTHADTHLHLGATDTETWPALLATVDHLTDYARALNGRADLLVAYREILRLDDIDDTAIRIEFGLPEARCCAADADGGASGLMSALGQMPLAT